MLTRFPHRASSLFTVLFAAGACAGGGATVASPVPVDGSAEAPAPPPLREGVDFAVYTAEGAPSSIDAVVAAFAEHDAVFVGERHDDGITHRVQALLFDRAVDDFGSSREVVLSLEMFERDVQYVLDEYLAGLITEAHLMSSARPWDNYVPDYRPMVERAREAGLEVVAANAPRRYANRASRLGRESLDALGPEAMRHLPPMPYPEASDAYRAEWDALMGDAMQHMQGDPLDAQTLWDASMGHAVATALDAADDGLVLHMVGGFHVENGTGTPEALEHYRPGTRSLIVAARPAADPTVWDPALAGLGHFVVVTQAPPGN